MRAHSVRRPPLRVVLAAGLLSALGVSLTSGAAAPPTAPAAPGLLRHAGKQLRPPLPDGCGDVPNTNGRSNPQQDFLCGTQGNDRIWAGFNDVVRGRGGDDKIYARNGAPNDIHGGPGYDKAWIDPLLDRGDGARWITAMLGRFRAAASTNVTPHGSPYNLPTVECDDDDDGSGGRHILLLDLSAPRWHMAAFNANPGVVDWQYVAWTTWIYKYNAQTKTWPLYFQSDWLWDRTYDLPDYKKKVHPGNIWRSFTEGADDEEVERTPFEVHEPGFYTVRFSYFWYPERVPHLSGQNLADMPRDYLYTRARKVVGKYATGPSTDNPKWCKFP